MYDIQKSKKHFKKLIALIVCIIMVFSAMPLSQIVFATPSTSIPVIQDTLLNDTLNPIVLIRGSTQTGHPSLASAMTAIGSNDGDYTIVVVQNYNMILNTDMNATNANATSSNASLTITSTFISDAATSVQISKTFSMQGSNTSGYNFFFNCDTTIHDCTFDVYGSSCSHMFGNGHNFTIGDNVVVNNKGSNGRIQLYGGGDVTMGSTTNRATTNLVIKSGTFAYAMAGNRNNVFTGDAKITVQGNAYITNLCACSQSANCFGAGSTSKVYYDGSDGAICATIRAGLNASGLSSTDTIDVYINSATSQDNTGKNNFANIILTTGNTSISNVYVDGNCQICTQIAATNLIVNDNATIRNGNNSTGTGLGTENAFTGILSLTGNLTLGNNSKYIHAGSGAQSIAKNIIVNGSGAEMDFYKRTATTAPVKITVGGVYQNPGNTLGLWLWNNVSLKNGDILLTYSNAANANKESYYCTYPQFENKVFEIDKNQANIIYSFLYDYPTYYKTTNIPDLYCYTEIGNSTNTDVESVTLYRKYVYNNVSGIWEVFNADNNGNYSSTPINQQLEHPQPNEEYRSNFESSKGTMVRLDEFGKYRITAAVGTNASGLSATSTGTACGNHISFYNIDNKGTNSENNNNTYESNASWADLIQTNKNCKINKAYLVMTTPLRGNSGADEELLKSNIINNPMKLLFGNDMMLSNGYLPKDFIIGKTGENDAALNADTPTLLYDNRGTTSALGEAMTITDVTDFVKAHGYGRYYGVDIPYEGNDVDASIAWRLIVLEEDDTMEYIRKTSLQIGPISNGNLSDGQPASIRLDLDGLTTPDALDGEEFGGQLLMIGSDNTTDRQVGGGKGSNLHNTFYPDPDNSPDDAIIIASNDPSTPYIDRPLGYWSQGLMDINGVNLTSSQVSHVEESNGAMGIDMTLLTVSNEENVDWDTIGGHNLYLTPSSPAIMLTSRKDPYAIGYIDVLGITTDVSLPKFDTDIWHTDISTTPAIGTDIVAGQPVIVKGSAINITPMLSAVQGSFNTKVIVNIDQKLTGIRDKNDNNPGVITAIFHNYENGSYVDENVIGVYDSTTNTITFDFGSEFLNIPLYNSKDDWIEFEFKADTDSIPTIDDSNIKYTNNIGVWGQTIYQNNEVIQTPYARYDYDEDIFDTYINQIIISKVLTGDLADPNQEFSFVVKLNNSVGGHYKEGTKIEYTGGVVDGITATAPADGTLTVNSNGEITFKLKHGQYVSFTSIIGSIEINESSTYGYKMSWENVLSTADGKKVTQNVGYDNKTGPITISENEIRQISIVNDKSMVPSTGVNRTEISTFVIMSLLACAGLALILINHIRKRNITDLI